MRIWDIHPQHLCRKHLLAEHRELHGLWNILTKHDGAGGYSKHPKIMRWSGKEQSIFSSQYQTLIRKFAEREYNHHLPLDKKKPTTGLGSQEVSI